MRPFSPWLRASALALTAATAFTQEPELPRYARFSTPGTDLLFALFQTSYSYPTDAEDLYPVVLEVTRQGVPLWSQMATVDPAWPFLNMECKVAWSPDFTFCACSYRTSRATTVVLALDFSAPKVKQQAFAIDDLEDAVLESAHDTQPQALSKAWTEGLEVGNDGVVKLRLDVARAQTHRVSALLEGKTGRLRSWEPVGEAAK